MDNINDFCGFSPQLVIPTTFEECFTYEEQILYLKQFIEESVGADLTEIGQRLSSVEASVTNLNNEVAEINVDDIKAQLQTINAELTQLKNKSSAQADSITALQTTVTNNKTATDTALAAKYDSSNVETGSGTLSPATSTDTGCEGNFIYSKNGNTVTVTVNMTKFLAGKNYVRMSGLPFKQNQSIKLASLIARSSSGSYVNVRIDGTWLYFNKTGSSFADDETLVVTVTYII